MPEKITAGYRIVTPMFIGDAEQKASGISPASVKGALRFWWRALNWGRVLKEAGDNEVAALKLLHAQEAALFGGLAKTVEDEQTGEMRQSGGQGAFLLRVVPDKIKVLSANELGNSYSLNHSWQSYLLGLGLMKSNHYLRSALVSGSFSVQLYCKNSDHLEELKTLLLLWGLLGGLGSRQRKGLGSISITELIVNGKNIAPENSQQVLGTLKKLIDKSAIGEPPYTAFSQSAQILCSPAKNQTPWQTLGEIAKDMQCFRGWGSKKRNETVHHINKLPTIYDAYRCKKTDHHVVYQYRKPNALSKQLPKSYVFGLPRSYILSIPLKNGEENPKKMDFKLDVLARDKDRKEEKINKRSRRASPVFIHIHQFPNNDSMIIQSFLPATFLPSQDLVQVKQKRGDNWSVVAGGDIPVSPTTDWQVIEDYLKTFSAWQPV